MGLIFRYYTICLVLYIMPNIPRTHCASINDSNVLLSNLLDGYNKNVRPVADQAAAIHVNVTLFMISIQELDEIRGIFSIMGIMSLSVV